jgi:hypothetical protein
MTLPLDYAPPKRVMTRRRIVLMVASCALAAMAVAAWRWHEPVISRIQYLKLQRACMNYSAPPDQLMFTADPAEAKRLAAIGGEYHGVYVPGHFDDVAGYQPLVLAKLRANILGPPSNLIFMHARRGASGDKRLVLITIDSTNGGTAFELFGCIIKPVGVFGSENLNWFASAEELFHPKKSLRVFAGQVDPNDESKFTIPFEMDGTSGVVDGQLDIPGGIILKIRERP